MNSLRFFRAVNRDRVRSWSGLLLAHGLVLAAAFCEPGNSLAAQLPGSFRPGAVWNDDNGEAINAHGGGILFHDGRYYWYGEVKKGPTRLPESNRSWNGTRVDFSGISCYVSSDLLHWHNEGLALSANDDPASELGRHRVVERPKVIYNPSTRRFVMWMHIDSSDYREARCGVAVSETPIGPFSYAGSFRPNAQRCPQDMPNELRKEFLTLTSEEQRKAWGLKNPSWAVWARDFVNGQMARDMTLFLDEDGKAYHIYASEENEVLHISQLTGDFLAESGAYVRAFAGSREAPALFTSHGHYYMVNSGCTGWTPNAMRFFGAGSVMGPWVDLGLGAIGSKEDEQTSFNSQSTFVLTFPDGNRGPVYIGDRWVAGDLEKSTYVWLPIDMNGIAPRVAWKSEWSLPP